MIRAEWTKLRTVPSTAWLLVGAVAATVAASAIYADSINVSGCLSPAECPADTTKLSLGGVQFGQAVVAVLALLAVTNEYGTRMIRTTLLANPRRITVLLAKASVVTAAALIAGALGVVGSLLAGRFILDGSGYPLPSLADGPTLRAAAGSVLYLGLIALLSLGTGTIIRDTAGAVTAMMLLLYVAPFALALVSDPQLRERLHRFGPTTAGQAIQATTDLGQLPIAPWAGLGVLAGYTAAALLIGAVLFTVRDA